MLEEKENLLLPKASAELKKAKAYNEAKDKRAATRCLKRKGLYEQQIIQLANVKLRIRDKMILLEGAKATTETVDALRSRAAAMDVDKTMDEINKQTDNVKQIWKALAPPISVADDFFYEVEDELEGEEVEGAETAEQLLQPASTAPADPAGRVPARPAPQKRTEEEDELAALQAETAL